MKSFNKVVDELFKPHFTDFEYQKHNGWTTTLDVVRAKYDISKLINKPYWGRDIGEPIVKICKRILEKPNRFCSLRNQEQVFEQRGGLVLFSTPLKEVSPEIKILLDKDTQVKFVLKNGYITNLSYLTADEQHLLRSCIGEWYESNRELLEHKKQITEQKRKDKYRQEMIDQYRDL